MYLYYAYQYIEDDVFFQNEFINLTVKYSEDEFKTTKAKMEEYYANNNDIADGEFYYNGALYHGFCLSEKGEYYAVLYSACLDSNLITFIAFSSEHLSYMNIEDALDEFPFLNFEKQIKSYNG